MKRTHIIIGLFVSFLILGSCREISINTVVNKDGSFTRTVTITGDSSDVFKPDLPYPVDSTWKKEFKEDTTGNKDHILTYVKTFENSDLLNQEFSEDKSWRGKINRKIVVERKFGFFYSYLVYKETIGAANPFHKLDYRDYISKGDMLWLTGKKLALNSGDSSKIEQAENAAGVYLQEAMTERIVATLKKGVEQLDSPAVHPDLIEEYRDSIALKVYDWHYNSTLDFVDYLAELTGNNDIYKLRESDSTLFKNLDNDMEFVMSILMMEDYKVSVELPGMITGTNSLSTRGNRAQWNVNALSILFEDFNMIAESRVINKWMFVIAGAILLMLVVFMVFQSRK